MRSYSAAAIQLCSGGDKEKNLSAALELLRAAADEGAKLLVLPELFIFWGNLKAIRDVAEPIPGPTSDQLADFASRHGVYIVAGSIPEQNSAKPYNTSLLIDSTGTIIAKYRKIHLIKNRVPDTRPYDEADFISPGNPSQSPLCETELGTIALSLCYDLRFPEFYIDLAVSGAKVLAVPSALSVITGKAHWHTLVRARAIEAQCFVIAPNQVDSPGKSTPCFGHSLIVDPWGEIIAELPAETGIALAQIRLDEVDRVRSILPSLSQRQISHEGVA
ncbi:MAG TPA: carbon-nitrogen hydrolase family protein [Thermoanaerobaculia bacterium]|jgi:predicted amidohydrolase|nr:carbon-nitrogen hydrolase family protein [Thermoanaerobaculia bacterium]